MTGLTEQAAHLKSKSIETVKHSHVVVHFGFLGFQEDFWTGLNDFSHPGEFKWTHSGIKAEINFTNWLPNYPVIKLGIIT